MAQDDEDPLIGRTLPGGYAVLELVGVGGMGRVYRAEQTALGRTVAVKVIHPHLLGEENTAARFITEARASSLLNHPNSVSVIDFGKTDRGELYLVMEFLRGKDLARVNYEEGPLPFRRIVRILVQVLAALSEAHHLGIIHRDLKPENIILEHARQGGDFVKVVDFGLAKMREAGQRGITNPGIVCGTPEYMSPEQGRGDVLDARSDVYALGVVLYQLLTGQLPFEDESPTQVVIRHLTELPRDPRTVAPERRIPDTLAEACLLALEKDVSLRYPSADAFAEALEDSVRQGTTSGPPRGSHGQGSGQSLRVSVAPDALAAASACVSCGALWTRALKFCGECGAPMHAPEVELLPLELPSSAPTMDELPSSAPLSLRGREPLLAQLESKLLSPTATLVSWLLVGEPGVGKSSLLAGVVERARLRSGGGVVVSVGPDPYFADVAYYALRSAIEGLVGSSDPQRVLELPSLGAEARHGLRAIYGLEPEGGDGLSPETRAHTLLEALRFALYVASENERPLLLAVDDLHLLDHASREAFSALAEAPPLVAGLFLLAASGQEPLPQARERTPLDVLPPWTVSDWLMREQVTLAHGPDATYTPLHLEQLVRFTREIGGVAPPRLGDLMAARVECVSPDARRALHALCVAGNQFPATALRELVRGGTDLDAALQELALSGMIDSQGGLLSVSHPQFREVVLATIPHAARRELHAIIADLAEREGLPLEVCAMHNYLAGHAFQALIQLDRVAKRAQARDDHDAAIRALHQGVTLARQEMARGNLDDPERALFLFLRKMGEALSFGARHEDAEAVLREALDLAAAVGDREDRAQVLLTLAGNALSAGQRDGAHQFVQQAQQLMPKVRNDELSAQLDAVSRML